MTERIHTIYHKGIEIIRFDYQGLPEDEDVIAFVDEVKHFLFELNRPTLQLTNITGIYLTPTVMKHITEASKQWEHLVMLDAIIGVTEVKRFLFQLYNTLIRGKARAFDTEEEAKEWLAASWSKMHSNDMTMEENQSRQ
jgi:hypothetical protein